jgi:hypothetical protein
MLMLWSQWRFQEKGGLEISDIFVILAGCEGRVSVLALGESIETDYVFNVQYIWLKANVWPSAVGHPRNAGMLLVPQFQAKAFGPVSH